MQQHSTTNTVSFEEFLALWNDYQDSRRPDVPLGQRAAKHFELFNARTRLHLS